MGAAQSESGDDLSRRQLVRRGWAAVAAGSLLPLSGCLGGSSLTVEGVETEVSDGNVITALVGVTNESDQAASATMVVQCNVAAGDTYTERRDITVLANRTTSYEFEFQTQQPELDNRYEVATEIDAKGLVEGVVDWVENL